MQLEMRWKKIVLWAFAAVIVLAFAYFVWPTRYQYFQLSVDMSGFRELLVRQDRITGAIDFLLVMGENQGWVRVRPRGRDEATVSRRLSYKDADELVRAIMRGELDPADLTEEQREALRRLKAWREQTEGLAPGVYHISKEGQIIEQPKAAEESND